jgi:hypothetical protein
MDAATRRDAERGHQAGTTALSDAAPDDVRRIRTGRHVQKEDSNDEKLEMGNAEH